MENEITLNMSLGYTAFLLGAVTTFVLRRIMALRAAKAASSDGATSPQDGAAIARAQTAASELRDVAHNMACDVNAHRLLVENVSSRLGASLTADTPDEQLILDSTVELLDANFELQCRLTAAEEKIDVQAKEIS
ncbi:MAG TPA: hypothetical protein VF175_08225, partial [Lacipirellula sp.]